MAIGRTREHDRNQIALDLLEWAKKDDSINLCAFCADKMLVPSKISDWAREDEAFREAYWIAKSHIGKRRELLLSQGKLHVKAYDLNANTYDHFLKEEKRLQAEFESRLRKEENEIKVSPEEDARHKAIMDQLSSLQSVSNHATSKDKTADKS